MRRVICSGEALTPDLEKSFFAAFDGELENLYGPTEAAVDVTRWSCERNSTRASVPIGRPISNTRIHIVDHNLHAVPVEITGELYIAGAGLARGYLNRPDLTAERFIPAPLSDGAGARMYRTGDLARSLPEGEIEYLGRIDHQVKIRGFRIELGEIEAELVSHAAISESVVVAQESPAGDRRLVAYVVPAGDCLAGLRTPPGDGPRTSPHARQGNAVEILTPPESSPVSADSLRQYLSSTLPEYMIPAAFVLIDRLPLSSNGKVDRGALPSPIYSQPDQAYVAPRNEVERELAEIFGKVLGVERVGVEDNFFRLGGHSLLATQVMSRVLGTFEVELPVQQLFESPTVARLSCRLATAAALPSHDAGPISRIEQPFEDALLTKIDALTEEQVDGLLRYVSSKDRREE